MFIASFIRHVTLNKGLLPKLQRLCKHLMHIKIILELFWRSNLIWSTCTVLQDRPHLSPVWSELFHRIWKWVMSSQVSEKFSLKCELRAQFFHRALISHCMTTVPHVILFQFETLPNYLFILLKGENFPSIWRLLSTREALLICTVWFAVLLNLSWSKAIPFLQQTGRLAIK